MSLSPTWMDLFYPPDHLSKTYMCSFSILTTCLRSHWPNLKSVITVTNWIPLNKHFYATASHGVSSPFSLSPLPHHPDITVFCPEWPEHTHLVPSTSDPFLFCKMSLDPFFPSFTTTSTHTHTGAKRDSVLILGVIVPLLSSFPLSHLKKKLNHTSFTISKAKCDLSPSSCGV